MYWSWAAARLAWPLPLHSGSVELMFCSSMLFEPQLIKPAAKASCPTRAVNSTQLGVELDPCHGAAFRGIRFCDDRSTVSADFPSGQGIGLRRVSLHARLSIMPAKPACGCCGERMSSSSQASQRHSPGRRRAIAISLEPTGILLVCAHGQAWSEVMFLTRRFGFRAHYRVAPWSPYVEIHWGPQGQAYVTPVSAEEVCVSVMTRFPSSSCTNEVIESIPALRHRLMHAEITTRVRGALTTTLRLRRVVCGNVALIGDASGSADAITGEGMAMGFRQALLLASAISNDSLARYAAGHPEILRLPQTHGAHHAPDGSLARPSPKVYCASLPAIRPYLKSSFKSTRRTSLPRLILEYVPRLGRRMLLPSHA